MKHSHNLVLFVLFLTISLTTCSVETAPKDSLVGLYGFKCPSQTKIEVPIKLSQFGSIQCASLNGIECVFGLNTEASCRDFISKNKQSMQVKTCTEEETKQEKHWCNQADSYFYNKWRCPSETGLKIPVRMNRNTFNVECLSKNGKSCYRGEHVNKACDKANTCQKFSSRMKVIECGAPLKRLFGHNGYFFKYSHWCKKSFAFFRYTGGFKYKASTGLDFAVRMSPKGEIQCLSADGKNCANGIYNKQDSKMLKPLSGKEYVTCGRKYERIHKITGFEDRNSWCRVAYRTLFNKGSRNPSQPALVNNYNQATSSVNSNYPSNNNNGNNNYPNNYNLNNRRRENLQSVRRSP